MSDLPSISATQADATPSHRGQALAETALMLPVLLILLLGAIDLGRAFFSYVTLHQAARIAANAASVDPDTTATDVPGIIADETAVANCDALDPPVLVYTRFGTPVADPEVGDYAQVQVSCSFSLLTPLANQLFAGPLDMRAVASFPVRTGCLGCTPGTGGGTPPPPPPEQCRTIPDMVGMSVGGARNAWISAGFIGAFNTTDDDTATVAPGPVIEPVDLACPSPLAIFNASVTVTTEDPDTEPPDCVVVPNLIGMIITEARAAWDATSFDGEFLPPLPDDDPEAAVESQELLQGGTPVTEPEVRPGITCLDPMTEPPLDIEVQVGDPWPDPPPAPCQVPHLIDKGRNAAEDEWDDALFAGSFSPPNGNFTVKSQSLVGFTWVPCESDITVSPQP